MVTGAERPGQDEKDEEVALLSDQEPVRLWATSTGGSRNLRATSLDGDASLERGRRGERRLMFK